VTSYGPNRLSQSPVARSHVVSVDPGGSPANSQMGAPTALRPRLAAGLPVAPKHWQIHHAPFIGPCPETLIPEIWVVCGENCDRWTHVQNAGRKRGTDQPILSYRLKIGRYMAITMNPTTPPTKTIISGSINEVRAFTLASTSVS